MNAVLREPLVHFFVAGALLFALDAWRHRDDGAPPSSAPGAGPTSASGGAIVVDDVVRRRLGDGWQAQNGVAPTPAELERMVDEWIREEVLYREGLARGLDRGDERVRARVAAKMGFVLEAQLVVPDPSDDELRAYFAAHADRWAREARVDFTHVFARAGDDADARAAEMLERLRAGASPNGLGDTFSGGRRYRGRQTADLAAAFGDAFVEGLDAQPVNEWALRRSRFGVHVVRIDRRSDASGADFEAARLDVKHAMEEERRQQGLAKATDALRERWKVTR